MKSRRMHRSRLILLATICLSLVSFAFAFDYAAWITDPLSWIYGGNIGLPGCTTAQRIQNVRYANQQMLQWCDSIEIEFITVKYPHDVALPYQELAGHNLKAGRFLSSFDLWPDKDVYAEAKYRIALPRSEDHTKDSLTWPTWNASGTTRHLEADPIYDEYVPEDSSDLDQYKTLWRPGPVCLENSWSGWQRDNLPDQYMPFHFRIVCDGDVNPNYQGSNPNVAYLNWFVKDTPGSTGWDCPYTAKWVKYPAIEIHHDSLIGASFGRIDTLEFTIDPSPGNGYFDKFWISGIVDWEADPPNVFSDYTVVADSTDSLNYHRFGANHAARLQVTVDGHHGFRLYKVEVWDEGWDRLVEHTEEWSDTIASYFQPTYDYNPANFAGWFTDDVEHPYSFPLAHLSKVLVAHGMPPINSSSEVSDLLYTVLDEAGLPHPTHAQERYIYWGDSTCFPARNVMGLTAIWTDTSSTPGYYMTLQRTDSTCLRVCSEDTPHRTYNGKRSLQCAIDVDQWGWEPYAYPENPNSTSAELANILTLMNTDEYSYMKYWVTKGGGERFTRWLKSRGTKVWHLRQSGRFNFVDNDNDDEPCTWDYWTPTRTPSTNEVRLSAWLSVASDVDGIMWYGALGDVDTSGYSGLFDWSDADGNPLPGRPDDTTLSARRNFCVQRYITPTNSYSIARELKGQINEISPIIESLNFVRNYASSAFESVYGATDCTWVARDYLRLSPDTSAVDFITSEYESGFPAAWNYDSPLGTYVQVARFDQPGGSEEDYWLLVVNRRTLVNETRRVSIGISNVADSLGAYMVDMARENESSVTTTYLDSEGQSSRKFSVILAPGDAELIHFYKPDTTALIITQNTVITAPAYFARNIIVQGCNLTIEPNLSDVAQPIILRGQQDTIYNDAHFFFTEGKGIILAGDSASGHNGTLKIVGSDSVRIVMGAPTDDPDRAWVGIKSTLQGADSIVLSNVDFKNATWALRLQDSGTPTRISNCSFDKCNYTIYATGRRNLLINDTDFSNSGTGLFIERGTIARLDECRFDKHYQHGIYAGSGTTLDMKNVTIENGKGLGGIKSWNADVWMKCCKVTDNEGIGIEAVGGSLVIADVDTSGARFGANWFCNNSLQEIVVDGPMFVWADEGYNSIYDDSDSAAALIWVSFDDLSFPAEWHNNYWRGLTADTSIWSHIGSFVQDSLGQPLRPDCTPARSSQPSFCYLPPLEDLTPYCITTGMKEELELELSSATVSYKDALESTSELCKKFPAVNRLLTVTYLAGTSDSAAISYLTGISDTTSDQETWHAAKLGIALSLSNQTETIDDAKTIYQQVIDSAGEDIYRKIDGQVGLLMTEMREEEADTVDGLTYEELTGFLDSLDQILGQRFVWTQYEITDSVVMYAPTRVDSLINIRGDGVLTILPHPGYKNPVVEFVDHGAVNVWGTDTTKDKGKLYVYGDPENRVTLHWEDSTGSKNIYSERGFVKMKHADFYGDGFVNQTQDFLGQYQGLRRATFQADSCNFAWFDDGVMARATDATSYMRACTLSHVGGNYFYSGFGSALILLRADSFLVEDCVFENNNGVGVYHGLANGVEIRNCVIRGGAKYGIWGASSGGGSARLECCTIESNGDTLPELWTLGVIYDLVGSHCSFSDSSGPLVKSDDPSYVDLEEGENFFEIWDEGYYIESGDTNQTWDVTWNTWSPSAPGDGNFYDYLWPHTSSKWTLDSSLASFIGCSEYGTSSLGGETWLIVDPLDELSGTMSMDNEESQSATLELPMPATTKLSSKELTVKSPTKQTSKLSTSKTTPVRKLAKADQIAMHHRELSEWRELRTTSRRDVRQSAIKFIEENGSSEFVPAALRLVASSAKERSIGKSSSKYLSDFAETSKNLKQRVLAERLSYEALALEGKPGAALIGLEEMMDNAATPRDSALALLSAMQIYCDYHNNGELRAKHNQVVVTDPYDLVRRTLRLSVSLDDLALGEQVTDAAIPTSYQLYQNYPNPFNPTTEIRFDLPEAVRAELKVFNILGQEVVTLVDDVRNAGAYRILWDGKNAAGLSVASGVYIYQLKTPSFTNAKKMMLLR